MDGAASSTVLPFIPTTAGKGLRGTWRQRLRNRFVAGAREGGLAAARALAAASPEEAASRVAAWTAPGDWVLVKASRGMKLERAVAALVEVLQSHSQPAGHA